MLASMSSNVPITVQCVKNVPTNLSDSGIFFQDLAMLNNASFDFLYHHNVAKNI